VKGQIVIADPQDQIKDLKLELDKFNKLASKYGVKSSEELDNLISNIKPEHHQPGELKPIGLPAD